MKGRENVVVGRLENGEHVLSCLSEIISLGETWKRDSVWEPFYGRTITCSLCGRNVDLVTSVVFGSGTYVVPDGAVRGKRQSLRRGVVEKDLGARYSKWCTVKIEVSKQAGVS